MSLLARAERMLDRHGIAAYDVALEREQTCYTERTVETYRELRRELFHEARRRPAPIQVMTGE